MNDLLPELLLTCTLRGSALILVAIAVAPFARRVFGRNGAVWLWTAAVLALLWPVMPATPFSVQNAWNTTPPAEALVVVASPATIRIEESAPLPELPSQAVTTVPVTSQSSFAKPKPAVQISMSGWVLIIWAAGSVLFLSLLCVRWLQTMRLVQRARVVSDRRWDYLRHRIGIKRRVRLAVTSDIRAPALAGILQPRVLIPESWLRELGDSELEAVWLHELGHLSRHDLAWEWLFAFARCVHWMNPLVWWAEKLARHDRELACDSWALEHAGSPVHYGHALLAAVQRTHAGVRGFGVLAMADTSSQIANRLKWISRYRRGRSKLARLGAIPAVLALLIFATGPLPAVQTPPTFESPPQPKPSVTTKTLRDFDGPPRLVEIRTRIVRMPESVANALALPIAEEGSTGINRLYNSEDFTALLNALRGTHDVEILNSPRLVAREGSKTSFDLTREFPYPESYEKAASDPSIYIPVSIVRAWVGLHMESQVSFQPPASLNVRVGAELRRLTGFTDGAGFAKVIHSEGANWFERLTSWKIPPGVTGQPQLVSQSADVNFEEFDPTQSALIFGFRDTGDADHSMINYIALEVVLQ